MKHDNEIPEAEVTPEAHWVNRRSLLKWMGAWAVSAMAPPLLAEGGSPQVVSGERIEIEDPVTPMDVATHYNNYYEFSFEKTPPAKMASALRLSPWTLEITGAVEKPYTLGVEELSRKFQRVDRVLRFRCVEGWSAVLPWQGILLRDLILAASPLSSARFVAFTSISAPEVMPNVRDQKLLQWPYREGLRLDEALHPLTLLATGLYGKPLPAQNGAPVRLVVPWKYGFKSIKAVVRIEVVVEQPVTSWNLQAPAEYGFYANVNPEVPHPRWSQASERPLGSPFYQPRKKTLLYNGYGADVADLYKGLDLRRNF